MKSFLQKIKDTPETNRFENTISVIDEHYTFTPCAFKNASLNNAVDENNGSCKIFAFAQLHKLTEQQTLHCFGDYYRVDVLENPTAADHQNIRNFMKSGWSGIEFSASPLSKKQACK